MLCARWKDERGRSVCMLNPGVCLMRDRKWCLCYTLGAWPCRRCSTV